MGGFDRLMVWRIIEFVAEREYLTADMRAALDEDDDGAMAEKEAA